MRRQLLALLVGLLVAGGSRADETQDRDLFEAKIRPVLAEHCYRCHSEDAKKMGKLKAELLLDTKAGVVKGGASGPAVVAGDASKSLILKAMNHDSDLQMPPSGKLSVSVLANFKTWIERGAFDPRDGKPAAIAASEIDWAKARAFWAFQPPVDHLPPVVKNAGWPKRDIDFFILAQLEKRGLQPVGFAGKTERIRRATFDLIGLPPTPDEIDAFVNDPSPEAFAKVVDRLLASPHHGERWGRYWLDIARYAEDKALAFVTPRPHAYRYRDWVVNALNSDMPYDRFLRLQLAGDLLDEREPDHAVRLAGLGFQGLGQEYHRGSVAAQVMADELDDRIDTLSRGLLGLTVACARCHDHKYDPIPTRDYYSLAAAYNGSSLNLVPLADRAVVEAHAAWQKQTKDAEAKLGQFVKEKSKAVREAIVADAGRYLQAAWQIRTLNRNKLPSAILAAADREKLHVPYLERSVKFLDQQKRGQLEPAVAAWLAIADKVSANADDVPPELIEATEELGRRIREALMAKAAKTPHNLIKTLSLNADAVFFVDDKDAAKYFDEPSKKELAERQTRLAALQKSPPPEPPQAHGIVGGGTAMKINIRGSVERPGDLAPPGFLQVIANDAAKKEKFTRLELAEAVASPKNPLTARVIVNRVWHYHFGRGIVGTTSNFGQFGDRPTHPELLDRLTVRFIESGWSLRFLHREMMLSAAYQLSSKNDPRQAEIDPENQYLWHFAARRLDFEAWRDAWLAVSGRLDPTLGGPSLDLNQPSHVRRTLYSKISRLEANKLLILFDFPDANVTSDRRSVTTVPQQQLFVLNSEFTIDTARAFAKRLETAAPREDDRIRLAFRLAYGRGPTNPEIEASRAFIRAAAIGRMDDRLAPWEQFAQAILAANEFMWVD